MAASTKITTKSQTEPMIGLTPYGAFKAQGGMDIAALGNAMLELPMTPPDPMMGKEFKSGDSFKTTQQGQNLFPGLPTIITGKNFAFGGDTAMDASQMGYTAPGTTGTRDVAMTLAKWAKLKNIDYDDLVKEFTALSKKEQMQAYTAISAKLKEEETQELMTPTAPMGMLDNSMEVAKEGGEPCIGCFDKYNPSPQAQDLNWFYKKEGGEAFPQANMYPKSWVGYSGTQYAAGGEAFPQAQTYLPYDRAGETRPNFMFAAGGTSDQFGGQFTNDQVYKIMEAGGLNMDPKKKRGKGMSKDQFSDYLMKNGGLTKYQARTSQVSDYGVPEGTYMGDIESISPEEYIRRRKEEDTETYIGDIPTNYDDQVTLSTSLQKMPRRDIYGASSTYGYSKDDNPNDPEYPTLLSTHNTERITDYGKSLQERIFNAFAFDELDYGSYRQHMTKAGLENLHDDTHQADALARANIIANKSNFAYPSPSTSDADVSAYGTTFVSTDPNYDYWADATTNDGTTATATSTAAPAASTSTGSTASATTSNTGSGPTTSTGTTTGSTAGNTGTTSNAAAAGSTGTNAGTTANASGTTNASTTGSGSTPQYTEEQIKQINQKIQDMMRNYYRGRTPTTALGISEMMRAGRNRAETPFGLTSALFGAAKVLGGLGKGLPMTAALPFKAAGKAMRGATRVAGAPLRFLTGRGKNEAMYGGDLDRMFLGGIFGKEGEDGNDAPEGTVEGVDEQGNKVSVNSNALKGPYFDIGTQQQELAGMRAVSGFLEDFNANKQALKDRKLSAYNTLNQFAPVERTPQMAGTYTANATMGSNVSPNITGKMVQDPGKSMSNRALFMNMVPQTPGDLNKPLPYSAPAFAMYGGSFEDGGDLDGEYDLDMDTIRDLIRRGYQIDFI